MFKKLYAICLLVDDFEKSLSFYRDVLGLKVNYQKGKYADFDLKGTSLAIFQKDEAEEMFPRKYMRSGGGVVLAFQVKNLRKSCSQLKKKGVNILEGPKTTSWGQKVAYYKDRNNKIWEISEPFD